MTISTKTEPVDYTRIERFACHDCGHDTNAMGELFMLKDYLWGYAASRKSYTHMLCIGCVEQRLNIRLNKWDFISCPLNLNPHGRWSQSLRLRHRLQNEEHGDFQNFFRYLARDWWRSVIDSHNRHPSTHLTGRAERLGW